MSVIFGEFEEGPVNSKVTAIHAALLHNGKVLIFHCRSYPMWTRIYDPEENIMNEINIEVPIWPEATEERPIEPSRIFCAGHCFMDDGKLLVAGGERDFPYPYMYLKPIEQQVRGLDYCFVFDLNGNTFWKVPTTLGELHQMRDGRWYPSLTILNDGRILAMGGFSGSLNQYHESKVNIKPERYTDQTGWVNVSETSAADMPGDISYFYPAGHLIPGGEYAGKVFFTTTRLIPVLNPTPPPEFIYTNIQGISQIFDPEPTGSNPYWKPVGGLRAAQNEYANHLLLPIRLPNTHKSRIIVLGGLWGDILDRVDMIDLDDPDTDNPAWQELPSMTYARLDHNSIILPDRKILVIGGTGVNGPALFPEFFDTDTLTWVDSPIFPQVRMNVPRSYHSTALLLPNAKIFLGGGRVIDGGDVEDDTERRIEIFKPGYLLDGDQPIITQAPTIVTYGETFRVVVNGEYALDSMAFIKPMSVTHGYNSEQRYIELAFVMEALLSPGGYDVTAPADSNIAPPGYYMLFVMKDVTESISGESRIPSNAVFILLS